ncbi:T9SS type A sorting domain-containing protein [Ferruginibacter albus]|uniref:T9SS type A sorting domain-containing protein n=1 Tax=Ferruginibacter albus TaxID=2875540 RepID=UPI001CC35820|nr:T9SS type A sorting domain-containing protein [Ferruginibacter albus]UAY51022.1 T9SS type A sorting domain-containing protein [Ferruginibacter albus]
MKKIYLSAITLFAFSLLSHAQSFTAGNIVVYKVGDGTTTLSNASFPITLDEYSPAGVLALSHPMPTAASGSNKRIVASGSATSEGQMTRSYDKRYLIVPGYDAATGVTGIASTTASANNRMVGIVGFDGSIDATTALTDAYSGNNLRGATSTNGTDIWVSGTPGSIKYTTKGATTSVSVTDSPSNTRTVNVFNGQLYGSSASGTYLGVFSVGSGAPSTYAAGASSILNGFPRAKIGSVTPSEYGFAVNPSTTIVYVADDNSTANNGGIQKWTLSGGVWSMAYVLNSGLSAGARSVIVDWSGANPVIYAITADATNKLVKVTDAGSSSAFSTLVTASANYVFRGLAFAPEDAPVPVKLTSFTAVSNTNAVQLHWITAQEINTKEFTVEKSIDGMSFTAISKTNAAGNTGTTHNYQSVDNNPSAGTSYYRLVTTDIDGNLSYSDIVKVRYSENISIFPNPVKDQFTISHPASTNAILSISDIQGKRLRLVTITNGSTSTKVSVNGLSKGQYIIKYSDKNSVTIKTLIKE